MAGGAAQQGPAAGHQLPHAKRLDQVVVGADLEAQHPIGFRVAGAHHQDRGLVAVLPQLTANIQTTQAREHQIEHHQGKPLPLRRPLQQLQGITTVAAGLHRKPLQFEGIADRFADRFVVFDD